MRTPHPSTPAARGAASSGAGAPPDPASDRTDHHAENVAEADDLEMTSPEGRPADPAVRGRATVVLFAIALGVVIVAAVLIARAGSPPVAIGIAIAAVLVLVLSNPVLWSSVLRARERDQTHHEHGEDRGAPGEPRFTRDSPATQGPERR